MRLLFDNRYDNQIHQSAHHLYIRPHQLLRSYVAHYTLTLPGGGEASSGFLTLVPDASGCLVFEWEGEALSCHVFGATTRTVMVENDLACGPVRFFVEFLPGGLSLFHREAHRELTDRRVGLQELNRPLFHQVEQAWRHCVQLDDFFLALDGILLSALRERTLPDALRLGIALLQQEKGLLTMEALSRRLCYSPRQVSRLFREYVGIGGKTFARLLRVNNAILRMDEISGFSRLAQEAGYYDQAHFIHEFQEVCGVSPGVYHQRKSDFYNETFKF